MSELLDGNLYEKMRIILPQHRSLMERYEYELNTSKRRCPIISEHQYAEFSKMIAEAVLNQQRVKIALYGKEKNECVVGIPVISGSFEILNDEGRRAIQADRVIDVSIVL